LKLNANIPKNTDDDSDSKCNKSAIMRELLNKVDSLIDVHCDDNNREGFTQDTNEDSIFDDKVVEQLSEIRQAIADIPHEKIHCVEKFRIVTTVLDMLDPAYELDSDLKIALSEFITYYFQKVLHMNKELHGKTNLCEMVDLTKSDDETVNQEEKEEDELIMEKLLSILDEMNNITHLKQNLDNNRDTRKTINNHRIKIVREFREKVREITRQHIQRFVSRYRFNMYRRSRGLFKGRKRRWSMW